MAYACRFQVTSDMRGYHDAFQDTLAYIISRDIVGDFHLTVGDLDSTIAENRALLDNTLGPATIWYPVIGNHESETPSDVAWLRDEYDNANGSTSRLPLKEYTNQDGPEWSNETMYSFDCGTAHIVVLNVYASESGGDRATDGKVPEETRDWLDANLAATSQPIKIIFCHEPPYPQFRHVGDSLDKYPDDRDAFWEILKNRGVQLLISGHEHVYSAIEIDGIWQVNSGNSGQDTEGNGSTFLDVQTSGDRIAVNVYRKPNGQSWYKANTIEIAPEQIIESIELRDGGIGLVIGGESITAEYSIVNGRLTLTGITPDQLSTLETFSSYSISQDIINIDPRFGGGTRVTGLMNIVEDPNPTLGGFLDLNGFTIGHQLVNEPGSFDLQIDNDVPLAAYSMLAGILNTSTGVAGLAIGHSNAVTGFAGSAFGSGSNSWLDGQFALASGYESAVGDRQVTRVVLSGRGSDSGTAALTANGNSYIVPNGYTAFITVTAVARAPALADGYALLKICFVATGTESTVELSDIVTIGSDINPSGLFDLAVGVADNSNELTVLGQCNWTDGGNVYWAAVLEALELGSPSGSSGTDTTSDEEPIEVTVGPPDGDHDFYLLTSLDYPKINYKAWIPRNLRVTIPAGAIGNRAGWWQDANAALLNGVREFEVETTPTIYRSTSNEITLFAHYYREYPTDYFGTWPERNNDVTLAAPWHPTTPICSAWGSFNLPFRLSVLVGGRFQVLNQGVPPWVADPSRIQEALDGEYFVWTDVSVVVSITVVVNNRNGVPIDGPCGGWIDPSILNWSTSQSFIDMNDLWDGVGLPASYDPVPLLFADMFGSPITWPTYNSLEVEAANPITIRAL